MKPLKRPHIKRTFLFGSRVWVWGCFMTRASIRPIIISRDLPKLMAAAKRRFEHRGGAK